MTYIWVELQKRHGETSWSLVAVVPHEWISKGAVIEPAENLNGQVDIAANQVLNYVGL